MFEYRLQLSCLCIVLYVFIYYESRRNLKTEFNELYIVMMIDSIAYLILDMYTYHLVNHPLRYNIVFINFIHRLFFLSLITDFYLAFRYEILLIKKEFKVSPQELLLLKIPFILGAAGATFLPIRYKITIHTSYSSGPAVFCVAACIFIYMVLSIILSVRYSSRKLERKYRSVIVSMLLMIMVIVLQMFKHDLLFTSVAVTMLVLSIYMSIGDPQIYVDEDIDGFNRTGFGEVLDFRTRERKKFMVISIEITNWPELTDMSCGISANELLSFAPKLGTKLKSPAYRARYNCISYIVLDTGQNNRIGERVGAAAQELISLELQSASKNLDPDVHMSIIRYPNDAGTTQEILTKIYSMLLKTYRGAIYFDEATGCSNRNAYENDLQDLTDTMRASVNTVCIMADVNGLKRTNDTYGHAYGDEAIRETASVLKRYFAGMGTVYRLGGDEFLIIIFDREAYEVEEKLREIAQGEMGRKLSSGEGLSFAIGTAYADENDEKIKDVIERADAAMYEDKKNSGCMRR